MTIKRLLLRGEVVITIIAVLTFLAYASAQAAGFNVTTTVPITINGATCTQSGSTFTCGGAPPPNVTCPDGSVHPPGYVCPVTPPSGSCAGFARTINLAMDWAAPTRLLSGDFGPNDIVVVSFTTDGGSSQSNNLPRISGAEYAGPAANRIAALSTTACSFVPVDSSWASSTTSSGPTIPFTVNNPYSFPGYYSNLLNNRTYYFNVKMAPASGCSVSCPMAFDLTKNGTP